MELEGKIYKSGKFWLVEIPSLDAMTQGKTRKEALKMAKSLVREMTISYFKEEHVVGFRVSIKEYEKGILGVVANDTKLLLALSLRRQRETSGSTIKEAAERLGSSSLNAYAQYEKGETSISIEKFEHLLIAANPRSHRKLRLV